MTVSKTVKMIARELCPCHRCEVDGSCHSDIEQSLIAYASDNEKQLASLNQENTRLREALEKIANMNGGAVAVESPNNHSNVAKAALDGTK